MQRTIFLTHVLSRGESLVLTMRVIRKNLLSLSHRLPDATIYLYRFIYVYLRLSLSSFVSREERRRQTRACVSHHVIERDISGTEWWKLILREYNQTQDQNADIMFNKCNWENIKREADSGWKACDLNWLKVLIIKLGLLLACHFYYRLFSFITFIIILHIFYRNSIHKRQAIVINFRWWP